MNTFPLIAEKINRHTKKKEKRKKTQDDSDGYLYQYVKRLNGIPALPDRL